MQAQLHRVRQVGVVGCPKIIGPLRHAVELQIGGDLTRRQTGQVVEPVILRLGVAQGSVDPESSEGHQRGLHLDPLDRGLRGVDKLLQRGIARQRNLSQTLDLVVLLVEETQVEANMVIEEL